LGVEVFLVGEDVLVRHLKILKHLIVKGLPRYLHTNAQRQLRVDHLLAQAGEQDLEVALARLFNLVDLVVFADHDLVQVDLVVEVLVELQTLERLQHFVHYFLQVFYQSLVVNFQV